MRKNFQFWLCDLTTKNKKSYEKGRFISKFTRFSQKWPNFTHFCFDAGFFIVSRGEKLENSTHIVGEAMYKCLKCGRFLPPDKEREFLGPNWGEVKCTCGSRIFMKVRPEHIKRVKAR